MPLYPPTGATDIATGLPTGPTAVSPRGDGGGSFASHQNAGALPQFITLFLPEERPIPSAQIFENALGQQATNVVQAGVAIPGAVQVIPQGCVARLSAVNLYVDNLLTTSAIRFSVLFEGNALPGLSNIPVFPGAVARAVENIDVFVRILRAGTLSVTFTNNDGGTYIVGASLSGWFWNEASGKLYMQQGQVI